jgi:hypothetical protein
MEAVSEGVMPTIMYVVNEESTLTFCRHLVWRWQDTADAD